MDFIMQYGEQALKAIEQMMKDPRTSQQSDLLEQLLKEGMLDKDGKGKLRLTPRAVSRMQQQALMEVFSNLRQGKREGHEKVTPGQGGERIEGTKPYQYGDPVSELDLHQTLHNALHAPRPRRSKRRSHGSASAKIKFDEHDFELHLHEGTTSLLHRRPPRHVRLDDALRPVPLRQESRDGHAGAGPHALPAGLDRLRRLLLRRQRRSPRSPCR